MYTNLESAALDLEKQGQLLRISSPVDGYLEMAEIHRRIFEKKGPAILYENVKNSPFRALSNLYGTTQRTDYLFRKTLPKLKKIIELKVDPLRALKSPLHYKRAPFTALRALPLRKRGGAVTYGQTTIDKLPLITSWPMDGGAFVTLPQVVSFPPQSQKIMSANVGMYRIQLSGNQYQTNKEVGLHYQIHRGIGNHHTLYNSSDEEFRVSICVGGPPSHAFSAIMPMPEDVSELTFAGMLADRRFRYHFDDQGHFISNDADFVITGRVRKHETMPEGPFGDHLGYYSLEHPFPVMDVDRVYHRKDAIWHFTVVGRPPAEDSSFGYLIHKIVEGLTASEFPGLVDVNAVDAAGVHPLLLAIGKERYMPFRERVPEEILTIANRILGSGQTSLAKFLIIAAQDDDPSLTTHDIGAFFDHVLRRIDWTRDLHFQTKTTIDTLDYSGSGLNSGSKVIIACRGDVRRELSTSISIDSRLPSNVAAAHVCRPGILALELGKFESYQAAAREISTLTNHLVSIDLKGFPLILIVDDAAFMSASIDNFLWATFTRSNPSHDIYGIDSFIEHKHWGCRGSLIIDARIKTHHAPELVPDKNTTEKVDKLFRKGGELYGQA